MAGIPAEVRINTNTPFPVMVTGANGIGVGKNNGIWTVQLNTASLNTAAPPLAAFGQNYVVAYNSATGTYSQVSLSTIAFGSLGALTQRSVTASPIVINPTDSILTVNINTGTPTCSLPQASTRLGAPLVFKDVGAQFAAHNVTLTPFAGDTIDGAATLVLNANRQSVRLWPFTDGVNIGWFIS